MNKLLISARKTKQKLIGYQQGQYPNIALIANVRGGSTLVADMLAAQRGVWFANEPFAPRHLERLGQELQQLAKEQPNRGCRFFNLNRSQYDDMCAYLSQLNKAALPIGTARHTQFPLRANRTCLKILRASWLTDFFAEQGMQILFVIRHPAAQALSVMRLGWPYISENYFEKVEFLERYFSSEQIRYGQKILKEGSNLQKAILSWVCDVIYPLKYSDQVTYRLFYEDLVAEPEVWIQHLCKNLQLPDFEIMNQVFRRPSGSSRLSKGDVNQAIRSGKTQLLLEKWCSHLDDTERRSAQSVLDCFEISCYSMYETMPIVSVESQ